MNRFAQSVGFRPRALVAVAAIGALTAAALLASPAAASAAQPAADSPQTTVYYNLLDLSSDQGTQALYRRIVSAARTVCPADDSRDLAEFAASRECQREAVSRAIHEIGSARLAAVYSQSVPKRG
ncbi:MAG: UrcA family protein [Steroidobacteraceae bacterium]